MAERKTEHACDLAVIANEYNIDHRRSKGKPNVGIQTPSKVKHVSYEKSGNTQSDRDRLTIGGVGKRD